MPRRVRTPGTTTPLRRIKPPGYNCRVDPTTGLAIHAADCPTYEPGTVTDPRPGTAISPLRIHPLGA